MAVLWPSAFNTTVNDINSALAQPWAKSVTFDLGGNKEMQQSITVAELAGYRSLGSQYNTEATVTSAPVFAGRWNIATLDSAAQTNLNTVIEIEVIYDVEFFGLVSPDLAANDDYKLVREARAARLEQQLREKKALPVPVGVGSLPQAVKPAVGEVKCEGKEQARKEPESKPVATLSRGWSLL